LDSWYGVEHEGSKKYPLSGDEARHEALTLHQKLLAKKRIGQLPNDFAPILIEKFPDYLSLFDMFDKSNAIAWGITGSGGAAFALSDGARPSPPFVWPSWARQVLTLDILI